MVSEFRDHKTQAELGREAGVHQSQIAVAKRVRREGSPALVQAVEAGGLTLHAAEQIRWVPGGEVTEHPNEGAESAG